jgi:hypothetical protein
VESCRSTAGSVDGVTGDVTGRSRLVETCVGSRTYVGRAAGNQRVQE